MRIISNAIALFASWLAFTGCQKEVSDRPLPNQIDSTVTGSLKKVVSRNTNTGKNYSVIEFEYDNAGLLKYQSFSSWDQNGNADEKRAIQFFRDNSGKVIRIGNLPDTSAFNTYLHYNNEGQLQSAAVAKYQNSYQKLDSITLDYNAGGRIGTWKRWETSNNRDKVSYYFSYEYDANGNIKTQVLYQDTYAAGQTADGIYDPVIATHFEYDVKQNPYVRLPELANLDWGGWGYAWNYSYHNPVKMTNDYIDPSGLDDLVTAHYQYDSEGRVISFVQDQNVIPGDITEFYYY